MADFNEEMEELRAQLQDAHARIDELEDERRTLGIDDLHDRAEAAEARAQEASESSDRLKRELDREKELNENLETRVNELSVGIQSMQREMENLQEENRRLRQQLDRSNDDLQRERQRSTDAAAMGARVARDRAYHNSELDKAVTENLEMRQEMLTLREELQHYEDAVSKLTSDLDDAAEDRSALESALRDANSRIAELTHELGESGTSVTLAHAAVDAKRAEVSQLQAQMEEAARRAAADVKSAQDRVVALERSLAATHAETAAIKSNTRVSEVQQELEALRQQLAAVSGERDETAALLSESNDTLTRAHARITELQEHADELVNAAVAGERARVTEALRELELARIAARDERSRYEECVVAKTDVEARLHDALARCERYEGEYGLEDAVQEQEALREAVRLRDADIARLTSLVATHMDAYDMLFEISSRLAVAAGHAPTVDVWKIYPDTDVRGAVMGTIEKLRSLNREVSDQNDALEAQRTRMLHTLRVHAENMGEKSITSYGLTAEQMMQVNEFIEGIKSDADYLPLNDRSVELSRRVRELESRIEDLNSQLFAARTALVTSSGAPRGGTSITVVTGGDSAQPVPAPAPDTMSAAMSLALRDQQDALRDALREVVTENRALRTALNDTVRSHEAALAAMKAQRGEDLAALRDTDARRFTVFKSLVDGMRGDVGPLHEGVEEQLQIVYSLLRNALDTGSTLTAGQMATLYRTFAAVILKYEESVAALRAEADKTTSAAQRAQAAETAKAEVEARLAAVTADFNSLIRVNAQTRGRDDATSARSASGHSYAQVLVAKYESTSGRGSQEALAAQALNCYGALAEALETLHAREVELSAAHASVRSVHERLGSLTALHTQLYASHMQLRTEVDTAAATAASATARAEAAEASVARLQGAAGPDTTRLEAALASSERLKALALTDAAGARAHAHTCEHALRELESHTRARILYLELWKAGASWRLERLTELAQTWVPAADLDALRTELEALRAEHAALCNDHARDVEVAVVNEAKARQCDAASSRLESALTDVEALRTRLDASQRALDEALTAMGTSGVVSAGGAPHTLSRPELVSTVITLRANLTDALANGAAAAKRADIASARVAQLEASLDAVSTLVRPAAAAPAAAAPSPSPTVTREPASGDNVAALRDRVRALEAEVARCRGIAETAVDALTSTVAATRDAAAETASLHEALGSQVGDDDAIIGRLQLSLLHTRASLHTLTRVGDMQRLALARARVALCAVEVASDEAVSVYSAQCEALRVAAVAMSTTAPPADFSLTRSYHATVMRLTQRLREAEKESAAARSAAHDDSLRAAAAELQSNARERECAHLASAASATGGGEIAQRLRSLHAEVTASQLDALRAQRALKRSQEERDALARNAADAAAHVQALEEAIVALRARASPLPQIVTVQGQQSELVDEPQQADSAAAVEMDAMRQRVTELQRALDAARAMGRKALYRARARRLHIVTSVGGGDDVDEGMAIADADLHAAGNNNSGGTPSAGGMEDMQVVPVDTTTATDVDEHMRAESVRIASAARATVSTLKRVIAGKNDMIASLRRALEEATRAREVEVAAGVSARDGVSAAAHGEAQGAITRLRQALEDVHNAPHALGGAGMDAAVAERMSALEAALAERDARILELERACAYLQQVEQRADESETSVALLQSELASCRAQLETITSSATARETAMAATVANLRSEIKARDARLKSFNASLMALKEEFVRAQEEHAVAMASARGSARPRPRGREDTPPVPDAPAAGDSDTAATRELRARVDELTTALSRARGEGHTAHSRVEELSQALARARGDVQAARAREGAAADAARNREAAAAAAQAALSAEVSKLRMECETLRARGAPPSSARATTESKEDSEEVHTLRARVRVLTAQLATLTSVPAEESPRAPPVATSRISVLPELHPRAPAPAAPPPAPVIDAPASDALSARVRALNKRVTALTTAASEARAAADAARAGEAAATAALTRVKSERDTLEKKLKSAMKRLNAMDETAATALTHMAPVAELHARIHELEETVSQLQAEAAASSAAATQARVESDHARARVEVAEGTVRDALARLRGGASSDDDRSALEARLREALHDAKRAVAEREYTIASKDGRVQALSFEVEAARTHMEKLQARVAHLTAYTHILTRGRGDETAPETGVNARSENSDAGGGPASTRVRELEDVVTALKRVCDRQRTEIQALKKAATDATAAAPAAARTRPAGRTSITSDDNVAILRGRIAALERDAADAHARFAELQKEAAAARSAAAAITTVAAPASVSSASAAAPSVFASLPLAPDTAPPPVRPSVETETQLAALQVRVSSLEGENAELRRELSAFDMAFFDEIEDLKWKYSQAAAKCRAFDVYMRAYPPTAGLPRELRDILSSAAAATLQQEAGPPPQQ